MGKGEPIEGTVLQEVTQLCVYREGQYVFWTKGGKLRVAYDADEYDAMLRRVREEAKGEGPGAL